MRHTPPCSRRPAIESRLALADFLAAAAPQLILWPRRLLTRGVEAWLAEHVLFVFQQLPWLRL